MVDYYEEFVYYALLTCCKSHEYLDKKRIREHNRAMDKLMKIQKKMFAEEGHCRELTLHLLNHEDIRVRLGAGAYCLMADVNKEEAVQILQHIKLHDKDWMTRVCAANCLDYCRPFDEQPK